MKLYYNFDGLVPELLRSERDSAGGNKGKIIVKEKSIQVIG